MDHDQNWEDIVALKGAFDSRNTERLRKALRDPKRNEAINYPSILADVLHEKVRSYYKDGESFIVELLDHAATLSSCLHYVPAREIGAGIGIDPDNIVHSVVRYWKHDSGPMLLQKASEDGVGFNDRSSTDKNPLHIAILRNNALAVGHLLDYGAELDVHTYRVAWREKGACFKAIKKHLDGSKAGQQQRKEWDETIEASSISAIPASDSLRAAIYAKDPALVKQLLEQGMSPHVYESLPKPSNRNFESTGGTPILSIAIIGQAWSVAKVLVEHGADVNAMDEQGRTALHEAFFHLAFRDRFGENYAGTELLIRAGADLQACDHKFLDPFEPFFKSKPQVLYDLGRCCIDVGRFDEAQLLFQRALRTSNETELPFLTTCTLQTLTHLADMYQYHYKFHLAERMYLSAIVKFKKTKSRFSREAIIFTTYCLAIFYTRLDRLDEAESFYARALDGYVELYEGNNSLSLAVLISLANAHREAGRFDSAQEWIQCVFESFLRDDESYTLCRAAAFSILGWSFYQQGRIEEARAAWEDALPFYEEATTLRTEFLFPSTMYPDTFPPIPFLEPNFGRALVVLFLNHLYQEVGPEEDTARLETILQGPAVVSILNVMLKRLHRERFRKPDAWLQALLENRLKKTDSLDRVE